jgi:DNA-binding NarL/FixJ family response regulator
MAAPPLPSPPDATPGAFPRTLPPARGPGSLGVTGLRPVPDPELKVLIACGQSLLRAGYRALLESGSGRAVADEAEDGQETVDLARQVHPDVVPMDVAISGLGCVEATRQLCADPGVPVILLSSPAEDERVFDSLRAGATAGRTLSTGP